jgi:tol-pal system protein YbgF
MHLRSILSGALVLLFVSAGAAATQDRGLSGAPTPRVGLPGVFGAQNGDVVMAQATDPRITELEERIRQLNGTIEELNFQVLQMQEQMRKMQEDNEFRFQELEKQKSDAGGKSGRTVAGNERPGRQQGGAQPSGPAPSAQADATTAPVSGEQGGDLGAPPRNFGTIIFDANGNVVGGTADKGAAGGEQAAGGQQATDGRQADGAGGDKVAALPTTDDPEELYRNSYQFILSGDYPTAEAGFRDHIARFPSDPRTADAHYWLGESLLGQQKYRAAAEVFLAANRDYPKSKKAPDMLLKLGVSLAGLNQRDVACATYAEVSKRYPDASGQLKQRLKQEQALASC